MKPEIYLFIHNDDVRNFFKLSTYKNHFYVIGKIAKTSKEFLIWLYECSESFDNCKAVFTLPISDENLIKLYPEYNLEWYSQKKIEYIQESLHLEIGCN